MIIPLAPDKIEIKKSCLIINQRLLIFIFLLALLKKIDIEVHVFHYEKLQL